eukprot:gene8770-718_t
MSGKENKKNFQPNGTVPFRNIPKRLASEEIIEIKKEHQIRESLKESLFKSQICRSWMATKSCKYGKFCQFAHGQEELRDKEIPENHRTILCREYESGIPCEYGSRCSFIHRNFELKLIDDDSIAYFTSINIESINFKGNRLELNVNSRIQLSTTNPVYVKFDPYIQWTQENKLFTLTIPKKSSNEPKFSSLSLVDHIQNPYYNTRHHDIYKTLISNENEIFSVWTKKWRSIRTIRKIHTVPKNVKIIQIKTYIKRIYIATCDIKENDICSIKSMTQDGHREIILNPISIGKITSLGLHKNGLVFFSFKNGNENVIAFTDYKGSFVKYFSKFNHDCEVNNIDVGIIKKENIVTWSCGNMVYAKRYNGNENVLSKTKCKNNKCCNCSLL